MNGPTTIKNSAKIIRTIKKPIGTLTCFIAKNFPVIFDIGVLGLFLVVLFL